LVIFWSRKLVRCACLATSVIVAALFLLPGRDASSANLRRDYIRSLLEYEGARYVWGGETRFGVDCSGLVRTGLIRANVQQGIWMVNPALFRTAFDLWWHDASARELQNGYRGRTQKLITGNGINQLDLAKILPGDIAITTNGVHVLAYVGDQTWIEADPVLMRVVMIRTPAKNPWFEMPVDVMRWAQFERVHQ